MSNDTYLNQTELCDYLQDNYNSTQVLSCFPQNVTKPKTEGGILSGIGPLGIPIQTLLVQIMLIQLMVQILVIPLKWMRQPRVIAEIIAGILLGPTAMGRIPGFTSALFGPNAMLVLNTVANLGLILFLFVMGLELDLSLLRRSVFTTSAIAVIGMIIPFGLGVAAAVFMYQVFIEEGTVSFIAFLLFIGVATSITAFPVLARILTELHLLNDRVGITTLGAAAINDVAAWHLLALCIAISSAGNPINILYIFLMLFGFMVLMVTVVRWGLQRGQKYLVTHNNVVSQPGVVVSIMICMAAAWFTSFIGVHAIFGAFVAGIIMPRREKFAVQLTEKMEDLLAVVFLPLYFAYSGIRTDVTKINTGLAWLAVLIIVAAATVGKVGGSIIAAKITGIESWRECLVLGIFMNCKGLVEIIILNIGLDAGVLNQLTFAIMVLLALITTFATTPLALWVYPPSKRGDQSTDTDLGPIGESELRPLLCSTSHKHLPVQLGLIQLVVNAQPEMMSLHQFRLLEITDRQSSVLKAMLANEEKGMKDPMSREVIKFAKLNELSVQNHFGTVDVEHLAQELIDVVEKHQLNSILLPWPEPGTLKDFVSWRGCDDAIDTLFTRAPVEVALLIETSAIIATSNVKIIVFYRGCLDDRASLKLALKFALSPGVQVTLVHLVSSRSGQVSIDLSVVSASLPHKLSESSSSRGKESARISFVSSRGNEQPSEKEKNEHIKKVSELLVIAKEETDDVILAEYKNLADQFPQHFALETMREDELQGDFITKRGYQSQTLFMMGRVNTIHDLPENDPLANLLGSLCALVLRCAVVGSVLLVGSRVRQAHEDNKLEKPVLVEKTHGSSKRSRASSTDTKDKST